MRHGSRARAFARVLQILAVCSLAALCSCSYVRAPRHPVPPRVDAYLKLYLRFRAYLQTKDDREGGDPTQFTCGPSIELYLKPLLKLKNITYFDLNDAKARPLLLESGYRIIIQPNSADENRAIEAVTIHLPAPGGILVTDRNRADLDWENGSFTWRYRNKLTVERTFSIHAYHFIPYVAAEPFYESQYKKWSTTTLTPVCFCLSASTSNSIRSTNWRTTREKAPTASSITSAWPLISISLSWKNDFESRFAVLEHGIYNAFSAPVTRDSCFLPVPLNNTQELWHLLFLALSCAVRSSTKGSLLCFAVFSKPPGSFWLSLWR